MPIDFSWPLDNLTWSGRLQSHGYHMNITWQPFKLTAIDMTASYTCKKSYDWFICLQSASCQLPGGSSVGAW